MSVATLPLATELGRALAARGWFVATAESCTAGLIAGAITDVAGSSGWFDRGFVTYSNDAKIEMLGVRPGLIATHGVVSREVALAMAHGALVHSDASIAIAVTGMAGPGGGTATKPIGLVHIAAARTGAPGLHEECRFGDIGRTAIRLATVERALALLARLGEMPDPSEAER